MTITWIADRNNERWVRADGTTRPWAPPLPAERFPGDPNIQQSNSYFYGTSLTNNSDPSSKHEDPAPMSGQPLPIHRIFYQTGDIGTSGPLVNGVQADHAAGRLPLASFKESNWAAAAAGSSDAAWDALIAELETYSRPTWLAINHEPEGPGGPDGPPADWVGMQQRFRTRLNAANGGNGPNRVGFMGILMAYTWSDNSTPDPNDYDIGSGVFDAFLVDHYFGEYGDPWLRGGGQWQNYIDWCSARGYRTGTGEWGLFHDDPDYDSKMTEWYEWPVQNTTADIVCHCYWDSTNAGTLLGLQNVFDGGTTGTLSKFHSQLVGSYTARLSDLGY